MRESCMYGSERGARGNSRPYRTRRALILALGGAAAWPFAARAQQAGVRPRIGYLGTSTLTLERQVLDEFRRKLRELGHVEGENITIEYRWAEGHDDRLANLAAELVRIKPDVIITTGTPSTFAVKQATDTIPIIFMSRPFQPNAGWSPAILGRVGTLRDLQYRERISRANVWSF
jgi:ABC transporter substrate binding protein